jgi:hypothetical protein
MNCLVLMPMLAGFESIRASVAHAVEEAGLEMLRLEVEIEDSAWHAWLLDALERADVVLADLTDHNAYVMYELGCAHQRGLPVCCIVDARNGRITSSVRGCPFIPYGDGQAGFESMVSEDLRQLLGAAGPWQPGSEIDSMLHEADELADAFDRTRGDAFARVPAEVFASRMVVAARRGHPDPRRMTVSARARHLLAWRLAESERVDVMQALGHWSASLR